MSCQQTDAAAQQEVLAHVHALGGPLCDVPVPLGEGWTVKQLKRAIEEAVCIPWQQQRLILGCKDLPEDKAGLDELLLEEAGAQEHVDMTLMRRSETTVKLLRQIEESDDHFRDYLEHFLGSLPRELLNDKEVMLAAIQRRSCVFKLAPDEMWEDKQVVMAAVERDGALLELAAAFRDDRDVVYKAIRQNGISLRFASERLRAEKDLVIPAVRDNGRAFEFVAESLRADPEVVRNAVEGYGTGLQYAPAPLRARKDLVLAAVRNEGRALEFAAPDLQADREVVLAALKKSGFALRYVAAPLRTERDLVLAAVRSSGQALSVVQEPLRSDKEVVQEAVTVGLLSKACAMELGVPHPDLQPRQPAPVVYEEEESKPQVTMQGQPEVVVSWSMTFEHLAAEALRRLSWCS